MSAVTLEDSRESALAESKILQNLGFSLLFHDWPSLVSILEKGFTYYKFIDEQHRVLRTQISNLTKIACIMGVTQRGNLVFIQNQFITLAEKVYAYKQELKTLLEIGKRQCGFRLAIGQHYRRNGRRGTGPLMVRSLFKNDQDLIPFENDDAKEPRPPYVWDREGWPRDLE
ncbi:MAG: hypothetical protein Q9218_001897 [Villophora microphyllina]